MPSLGMRMVSKMNALISKEAFILKTILLLLILSLSIPEKISEIGYYQFQAPT
jgi:hypothetical protein